MPCIHGLNISKCKVCLRAYAREYHLKHRTSFRPFKSRFRGVVPLGMKHCFQCGKIKSKWEFYRNKSRKDGLASTCKDCKSAYGKTEAGRKYRREYQREYVKKNPKNRKRLGELTPEAREARREYYRQYYMKHKVRIDATTKKWRAQKKKTRKSTV